MNQAPHDLDLLCHLAGQPHTVVAWTRTNLHRIAVEDTATALLRWDNGATGYFYASTADAAPRPDLEIVGTRGIVRIGSGKLSFDEFAADVRQFLRETDELWNGPALSPVARAAGRRAGRPCGGLPRLSRGDPGRRARHG